MILFCCFALLFFVVLLYFVLFCFTTTDLRVEYTTQPFKSEQILKHGIIVIDESFIKSIDVYSILT